MFKRPVIKQLLKILAEFRLPKLLGLASEVESSSTFIFTIPLILKDLGFQVFSMLDEISESTKRW